MAFCNLLAADEIINFDGIINDKVDSFFVEYTETFSLKDELIFQAIVFYWTSNYLDRNAFIVSACQMWKMCCGIATAIKTAVDESLNFISSFGKINCRSLHGLIFCLKDRNNSANY